MIIRSKSGVDAVRSQNVTFDNVQINSLHKPVYKLNKAENITFKNIPSVPENGTFAKILNAETKNIVFQGGNVKAANVEILNGAETSQVKFK